MPAHFTDHRQGPSFTPGPQEGLPGARMTGPVLAGRV